LDLDPLIAEAKRRAKQRRVLVSLGLVLLAALSAGLTLTLHSSGGGPSGGVVTADYPHEGVSFRYPGAWTRIPGCVLGGVALLTTAQPARGCPTGTWGPGIWPKEPLRANGISLELTWVPLRSFYLPGVKRPQWNVRRARQTAWAARPIYDYSTWQDCPAAVRGKDYFAALRGFNPFDGMRPGALEARAVICGPNLAAGKATVRRILASIRFTK
jgi:hypothetical protein